MLDEYLQLVVYPDRVYTNIYVVFAAGLFLGLLAVLVMSFARKLTDVIALFVLTTGLFYGFRAFLLATGLDTPTPAEFFPQATTAHDVGTALLWLSAYLAAFGLGVGAVLQLRPARNGVIFLVQDPPVRRMTVITVWLTVVATAITAALLIKYGGTGALIRAVKVQKELTGSYVLKLPAILGAVMGAATFIDSRRMSQPVRWRYVSLACGLVNAVYVAFWGQRSLLVVILAFVALSWTRGRESPRQTGGSRPTGLRSLVAVLAAIGLVGAAAFGLRIWRDTVTRGEVGAVVSDVSVWRKVSVSLNSTGFDRAVMAFRDWPTPYPYRNGGDFAEGTLGAVPHAVWSGAPVGGGHTGAWFRRVYEPDTINGWPPGTPADWYLNYGPMGLLFGGLGAGVLYGFLARAQRRSSSTALNTAIALVTVVYVFQLGWPTNAPQRIMFWLLPLSLLSRSMARKRQSEQERHLGSKEGSKVRAPTLTPAGTKAHVEGR